MTFQEYVDTFRSTIIVIGMLIAIPTFIFITTYLFPTRIKEIVNFINRDKDKTVTFDQFFQKQISVRNGVKFVGYLPLIEEIYEEAIFAGKQRESSELTKAIEEVGTIHLVHSVKKFRKKIEKKGNITWASDRDSFERELKFLKFRQQDLKKKIEKSKEMEIQLNQDNSLREINHNFLEERFQEAIKDFRAKNKEY